MVLGERTVAREQSLQSKVAVEAVAGVAIVAIGSTTEEGNPKGMNEQKRGPWCSAQIFSLVPRRPTCAASLVHVRAHRARLRRRHCWILRPL